MKTGMRFFAVLLLIASMPGRADLIVSRSIIELAHDETISDVVLINNDETSTLYVQVDPYKVQQPGAAEQELVPLTVENNGGLLVSPNKLAIPPGGRSLVRILNLEKGAPNERIYRVNFIPVAPPVEVDQPEGDVVRSRLEVVVAYQVLVMIRPQNPAPVHTYSRNGTTAFFSNSGNSNYLLTDGEQCNPQDAADCRPLPDHRVYQGNSWSLELPFDAPFSYKIRQPDGMSAHRFD